MRFKEDRQQTEIDQLRDKNPKLLTVLLCLDMFTAAEFNKEVCVTSVFRTKQEQEDLYKDVPDNKKVLTSPHMVWKAADIRSTDFTDKQITRMLTLLNCFTYTSGQGRPVALYHTIAGNTYHFHIQTD